MESPRGFFSESDEQKIIASIQEAEATTSGEIRVHVEKKAGKKPIKTAGKAFKKLGMHKTGERNGVLFFLGIEDRVFTVIGDKGIHAKVPENFWDDVKEAVLERFRQDDFTGGLAAGIRMAGEKLGEFFPCAPDDVNELPDAISYGGSHHENRL